MPSRWLCTLIIVFWCGTMGYMFYRDWLPWLTADKEAPPFVFELADEVVTQYALWTLYRNDQKIGTARTTLRYTNENAFEWTTTLSNLTHSAKVGELEVKAEIPTMTTRMMVTPSGELIRFTTTAEMQITLIARFKAKFEINGEVQGNSLRGQTSLTAENLPIQQPFGPIELKSKNVFSPMQPLFRIKGLQPGRSWKMNDFDPLNEAFRAGIQQMLDNFAKDKDGKSFLPFALPSSKSSEVLARVSDEIQELQIKDKTHSCYVIDYRGDNMQAKTWVKVEDGMVLRQEAFGFGEQLILQRE